MNELVRIFKRQKEDMLFFFLNKTRYLVYADTCGFENLQVWFLQKIRDI